MGEYGEGVWPGDERDGHVDAESWGAAVFVGDVVTGGACEKEWIAQCLARTERSAAQSRSGGSVGGETCAASVVAPVVCGAQCCHCFVPHFLLLACPPRLCWTFETASAPACLKTTRQSSASPGWIHADEGAGRGYSALPPLLKPVTGAAAGAEWFVTGTVFGVWKSSISLQRCPVQLVVG